MRKEKQYLLDELQGQIEEVDSFVIMNYIGLKANVVSNFRDEIAKSGGNLEMVKKTVLVKAAEAAGVNLTLDALPGHIGLVFAGEDPLETTKLVFKYKKDTKQAIDVLAGRIDGVNYNAAQVETLSKLPSKDEMRAQLLSTFVAPMSQTVGAMNSLLTSVINCLDQKSKQES